MVSKVRFVFVTACAVLFVVGGLASRPGATVTRSGPAAQPHAADAFAVPSAELFVNLRAAVHERGHEIAHRGSWYRTVTLYNKNSSQEASFRITPDGIVAPEDRKALKRFFRCRRSRKRRAMHPGVLAKLVDLAEHYEGRVIEVISGYRARPYGVRGSKHFQGRAIDLRVRNVKLKKVRDYLWRNHSGVGVGYYPNHGFVHVDHRQLDREAAWTTRRNGKTTRSTPRWARIARR